MLCFVEYIFELWLSHYWKSIEYKETLAEMYEKMTEEQYDELIISEDFNSDRFKGKFLKEL